MGSHGDHLHAQERHFPTPHRQQAPSKGWATFDSYDAADQYAKQLEGLLAQGVVPLSLLERSKSNHVIWTVQRCIVEYPKHNSVPDSDVGLLETIRPSVATIGTGMNYDWAEGWISEMKRTQNLAPSTIRHRHGALARSPQRGERPIPKERTPQCLQNRCWSVFVRN
jgi:hypothetical protein